MNIFAGTVVAITQQSLWGRVLNYVEEGGGRNANYRAIVGEAYRKEGLSAFFTPPKGVIPSADDPTPDRMVYAFGVSLATVII